MSYFIDAFVKGFAVGDAMRRQVKAEEAGEALAALESLGTEELLEFGESMRSGEGTFFERLSAWQNRRPAAAPADAPPSGAAGVPDEPLEATVSSRGRVGLPDVGALAAESMPPLGEAGARLLSLAGTDAAPRAAVWRGADTPVLELKIGDAFDGATFTGRDAQGRALFTTGNDARPFEVGSPLSFSGAAATAAAPAAAPATAPATAGALPLRTQPAMGVPALPAEPLLPTEADRIRRQGGR